VPTLRELSHTYPGDRVPVLVAFSPSSGRPVAGWLAGQESGLGLEEFIAVAPGPKGRERRAIRRDRTSLEV